MSDWNEDIYQTPDTSREQTAGDVPADETAETADVIDTKGIFSGNQSNSNPYGGYGAQQNNNGYNNNPYGGYGAQQNNNAYNGNPYGSYGTQQNNNAYNGNPYGGYGTQQNNNAYNGNPYGGYGAQQNNNAYNGNPYGGYGAQQNNNPYNNNPYGGGYNNMYSPYAAPQKKTNTGLIIAIVVIIIVLFLVAVFALAYKAVNLLTAQKKTSYDYGNYYFDDGYDDDYGFGYGYDDYDYSFGGYDDDDGYTYVEEDDQYYTLHDDIKYDLSYSVDYEYFDYDTDYENVYIAVDYPVIAGENVQNLDQLNETIQKEVTTITDYFENEYEPYIENNEDGYFQAYSCGYVTYMDEDRLSIVFSEQLYAEQAYADHVYLVYLDCINIDMEKGVILDNNDMLSIDDDFSVDFRKRSDEQNGEIDYLTYLTDQQITDYFNSDDIIVFYTPKGMEIGFNYEQGWVTVTYEEYEQYLKVF
jgi:hypothetical protein